MVADCEERSREIDREENISRGLVVVAYNSLGWNRTEIVRIPIPPGISSAVMESPQNETVEIGPGDLNISFSSASGTLESMYNMKTRVVGSGTHVVGVHLTVAEDELEEEVEAMHKIEVSLKSGDLLEERRISNVTIASNMDIMPMNVHIKMNEFFAELKDGAYGFVSLGDSSKLPVEGKGKIKIIQKDESGAYIFRPCDSLPNAVSKSVVRGPLLDEIHQKFISWIYQVTRLYKDKEYAEFEYTVRDHRSDWSLLVNEPVAGNYYPLNLGMFTSDNKSEFSILVDRATGGSSIEDGEVKLMLHRHLMYDDSKGVNEALDEIMRGNYYVSINRVGDGARWHGTTGQEVYSPLVLAFTHEV
ncbi:probable alpha-mannosidase At5g66150 [Pyrus communis]|uniref:probable alpha-mannosidase At5g66150 n=1 Tax=Pyrus communis TaxID=23211 RepID=UPI0035BF711A